MKTLQKTYTGKYAPNHLEFDYWIDLTADTKGSVIKTYNGTGWVEISGDSEGQIDAYTKAEVDSKFGETNTTVASIQDTIDLQNMSYFTVYYNVTDTSTPTTLFGGTVNSFFPVTRVFIDGTEVDLQSLYDTTNKMCAYTFSKTGTHVVKVYIKDDKSITLATVWAGNKSITKIDFTGFNPKQCGVWASTFTSSSLSEITFPNGFYFNGSVQVPFSSTQIKQFDLSNFDPQQLNSVDFLSGSNVQSLVMRGITTQRSFSIPGDMSTLREVIIQDCDMSAHSFSMFQSASQLTSLEKIDLSGSKIKLTNSSFGSLPSSVTQLILNDVDFSTFATTGGPLVFGNYSGTLDFSKCKFNYTDSFFTGNQAQLITAPNCSELIWDGLEVTLTATAPMFGTANNCKRISLKNAKINVTCASGLFLWQGKAVDVDLTGATISGNINGLCDSAGKINLNRVTFVDATCVANGSYVFTKPMIDLTTASGSISAEVTRPIFLTECTVYYDPRNLNLSSVINNAKTYSPAVIFVDTFQGVAAPNKVSQLHNDTIGCTAATTTASLVTDKNLVVATISANDAFSLASVPAAGEEIHTIVKNSGDADVVVTIPTESPYVNLSSDSLTVVAGGHAEINAVSDGTNVYIRTL